MRFLIALLLSGVSFAADASFYGSCDDPSNNYCTEFLGAQYQDVNERASYCELGSGKGQLSDSLCNRAPRPGCRLNIGRENENVLYGYGNVADVLKTICDRLGGELVK